VDAILNHTSDRSVEARMGSIQVPANLGADSATLMVGAAVYDATLWAVVAFMDRFPHMTAKQYEAWVAAAKAAGVGGGEGEAATTGPGGS
ncbi:MAG: hypothetical protein P8174_09875, partial [Gemmatimonadota bacterium]